MLAPVAPWLWIRRVCWIAFAGGLLFYLTVCHPFVQRVMFQTRLRDFAQEWASARNYFTGVSIYENQETTFRHYLGFIRGKNEDMIERNAHPPTTVLLVLPFGVLDYSTALFLWNALSLAALAASIYLIARELRIPLDYWSVFPIFALILLCAYMGPLRPQLEQGQWNLFLLLMLVGVWKASRSGQSAQAGLLLGLATAVKLFPGLLFVVFVLQRRWRIIGWGIASFLAMTLLTLAVLGFDTYRTYLVEVIPYLERFRGLWAGVSIKGFWSKLFDPCSFNGVTVPLVESPWLARALTLLCSALILQSLVRLSWRSRSPQEQEHVFALAIIAMPLVSPIAWDHYLLLLLLPLMIFGKRLPNTGRPVWSLRGLTLMLALHPYVYWWPILCDPRKDWTRIPSQPWQTLTALSMHTYALVGLFLFGVFTFSREAKDPTVTADYQESCVTPAMVG